MVDGNNVDQRQTENRDIQPEETDEENPQIIEQFHFHHCCVHLGSSDIHNVTIANSANHVPQVTDRHRKNIGRGRRNEIYQIPHAQSPTVFNNALPIPPPCTGRIHISFSVDRVLLFWACLATVSCLVFIITSPRLCSIGGMI